MTTIYLMTADQLLQIGENPKLASGDQNSVLLNVEFDAEWDGYARSAVFFTEEDKTVYEAVLTDNECIIPHEVLDEAGTLYIGVRGVNSANAAVKTSILVKYKIEEGAPSGEGTTVEPTASVYQQLIGLAEDTRNIAKAVREDFEAGAIPALQEQNKKKGFMFWVGTKAEYENQKDGLPENVFCILTDDTTKADMLKDIANLKDAVYGVDLGTAPIQYDVFEFDYFVIENTATNKKYIFNDLHKLRDSLQIKAHQYFFDGVDFAPDGKHPEGQIELWFYWGNGGFMVDTLKSYWYYDQEYKTETQVIVQLPYDKIYGFKYPQIKEGE